MIIDEILNWAESVFVLLFGVNWRLYLVISLVVFSFVYAVAIAAYEKARR